MHLLNSISQFDVFAVHPTTASSYARTFSPSGAKNDVSDTASLMDLFIKHPEKIRRYNVEKDSTILNFYNEKRRYAVDDRTKFGNQLSALLKKYYPVFLQVNGDHIYSPLSIDFLIAIVASLWVLFVFIISGWAVSYILAIPDLGLASEIILMRNRSIPRMPMNADRFLSVNYEFEEVL